MKDSKLDTDRFHVVAIFDRGSWQANVVDRNGGRLNHSVSNSCRYMVCLVEPQGYCTDWPIQYDDGSIRYSFEAPRDAQRAAKAAYRWIGQHS